MYQVVSGGLTQLSVRLNFVFEFYFKRLNIKTEYFLCLLSSFNPNPFICSLLFSFVCASSFLKNKIIRLEKNAKPTEIRSESTGTNTTVSTKPTENNK